MSRLSDARVLVVDDDPVLRDLFVEWFRRVAGWVREAEHGADAIQLLARYEFDLIVTDLLMPVLDGWGLLRHLRSNQEAMPVVICVSGNSDLKLADLYELGAAAVLAKPVDREQFVRTAYGSLVAREELWKVPSATAGCRTLVASFCSVASALSARQLAIGRGGLCIATAAATGEPLRTGPVDLEISFAEDQFALAGQGLVRWTGGGMAGVELTYLTEECRARVQGMAEGMRSFIPDLRRLPAEQNDFTVKKPVAEDFGEFLVGAAGFEPATSTV